jgi:hypothetical protein
MMEVMKDDGLLKSRYFCMALLKLMKVLAILFVQVIAIIFVIPVVMFVFCLITRPKSFVVTIVSVKSIIHLFLLKQISLELLIYFLDSFQIIFLELAVIELEFI